MRTALRVLGLFVFVALASCGGSKEVNQVKSLLNGLEHAEVTFYQLKEEPEGPHEPTPGPKLHRWDIENETVITDPEMIASMRAVLTDPSTYGTMEAACFEPGMAIRFKSGEQYIDFVICLHCLQIEAINSAGKLCGHWILSNAGISKLENIYTALHKDIGSAPSVASPSTPTK